MGCHPNRCQGAIRTSTSTQEGSKDPPRPKLELPVHVICFGVLCIISMLCFLAVMRRLLGSLWDTRSVFPGDASRFWGQRRRRCTPKHVSTESCRSRTKAPDFRTADHFGRFNRFTMQPITSDGARSRSPPSMRLPLREGLMEWSQWLGVG